MVFREIDYELGTEEPLIEEASSLIIEELYPDIFDPACKLSNLDKLKLLSSEPTFNYCYEDFDEVVSVGSLGYDYFDDTAMTINRVVVKPSMRSHDLGRLTLMNLEIEAESMGVNKVNLIANNKVLGFYKKLGYQYLESLTSDRHILTKAIN